jgi:hypothetical protein
LEIAYNFCVLVLGVNKMADGF